MIYRVHLHRELAQTAIVEVEAPDHRHAERAALDAPAVWQDGAVVLPPRAIDCVPTPRDPLRHRTRVGGTTLTVRYTDGVTLLDGDRVVAHAPSLYEAYDLAATRCTAPDPIVDPAVARAKLEILDDVTTGRVPAAAIHRFDDLDDHVDMYSYGGMCDDGWDTSEDFSVENGVMDALDAWIRRGGLHGTP